MQAGKGMQMIMTQSSTGSRLIGMIMACSLVDIIVTPTIERTLITAAIREPPRSLVDIKGKQHIRRNQENIVMVAEALNMVVIIRQACGLLPQPCGLLPQVSGGAELYIRTKSTCGDGKP